jgi:hypothetical protein
MKSAFLFGLAALSVIGASSARACVVGEQACPQDLRFALGAVSIKVSGELSAAHAEHVFRVEARAGQTIVVVEQGAAIRGQLFLQGPVPANSDGDDLYINTPYKLPANGTYEFTFTANTMAEGAYGPFRATITIK